MFYNKKEYVKAISFKKGEKMFNSSLISISQEISNGRFNYRCPIIEAVNQTYTDIIHDAIAEWRMLEPSDEGFEEYFEDAFPPGFISRDRARAKQIIYDLRDMLCIIL